MKNTKNTHQNDFLCVFKNYCRKQFSKTGIKHADILLLFLAPSRRKDGTVCRIEAQFKAKRYGQAPYRFTFHLEGLFMKYFIETSLFLLSWSLVSISLTSHRAEKLENKKATQFDFLYLLVN